MRLQCEADRKKEKGRKKSNRIDSDLQTVFFSKTSQKNKRGMEKAESLKSLLHKRRLMQ
jgi:hypothetical protein